ncbi:MAG TPA: hypothetical protein VFX93_14275, partial [Xanthomonadaceae bacterium]|nr:hypothetical protein [Xanthomonadaceae bacterium]
MATGAISKRWNELSATVAGAFMAPSAGGVASCARAAPARQNASNALLMTLIMLSPVSMEGAGNPFPVPAAGTHVTGP